MIRRPPRSPRTDTLFPPPTLFRSRVPVQPRRDAPARHIPASLPRSLGPGWSILRSSGGHHHVGFAGPGARTQGTGFDLERAACTARTRAADRTQDLRQRRRARSVARPIGERSEEHTSELQSLMRISYAVFCLKKNTSIVL